MIEGEKVEFECSASGHPFPSRYFWTVDGEETQISTSNTYSILVRYVKTRLDESL